ncbi:AraC family transcriptional regulator [Marinicella meishanensis]|uniref:AraC family transcriptional regulator n=1 Tax=Marinicella meishanensis TaxID=2873263 RepID=UPI001CBC1EE6|nr:AraC family transcriptional regulator [Marinicella sp. NBU2979]
MNVIDEIFKSISFDACIYLHSAFCSPWGVTSSNPGKSSFHVIAYGNCQLEMAGQDPLFLSAGDLIFFSRDTPHKILNPDERNNLSTTLICGQLSFQQDNNPILQALPRVLHITANEMDQAMWFKSLFQQIVAEAESDNAGRQLVLDKLAEILFIYVVRYYAQSTQLRDSEQAGLFMGLADPNIAKALIAFHRHMDQPWNLQSLAAQAAMSRSKLASRFSELLGVTPLKYMTHWRMQLAAQLLKNSHQSIYQIALSCGYQSEAAFIKVFKKQFGMTPGQSRKMAHSNQFD